MRVGYFIGTLNAGGLERFVMRVSKYSKRYGLFEPIVICLVKDVGIFRKELDGENIKVYKAPANWYKNPFALMKFSIFIRKLKMDIIHSQVNYSLIQQWLTCIFSGSRFLVTERNCYPLSGLGLYKRRLQFYLLKIFKVHYSANSSRVADHLAALMKFPVKKIPVINNGVEYSSRSDLELESFRKEYLNGFSGRVIGYVARYNEHKGHSLFVDVIEKLRTKYSSKELKICLVGEGPLKAKVFQKISDLSLSEYFVDFGLQTDMTLVYNQFDLLVLLSSHEGMPNVVLEAMANGVPVLANAVGNIEELLENNCGVVNKYEDAEKIAQDIEDLLNNKRLSYTLANNGKKKIFKEYSLEITVERLLHFYSS